MAKQLNFDLGEEHNGPCCAPCGSSEGKKYYPSIHHSGKRRIDIPDEGLMTVRYKKVSSSEHESERDGKTYSCCLEVREIVSAESDEAEAPSKRDKSAEDSLDSLMAEKQKSSKKGY